MYMSKKTIAFSSFALAVFVVAFWLSSRVSADDTFAKLYRVDSTQISAAATAAVLSSPKKEAEAPKYMYEMNRNLLLNGINYKSKSVFATDEVKKVSQQNIVNVLTERKKVLLAMLATNPKLVGAYALPLLTRSLLPSGLESMYEQQKTITGTLVAFHKENFLDQDHDMDADFEYQIVSQKERYAFYPTKPVGVQTGTQVSVRGLLLDRNIIGEVSVGGQASRGAAPANPPTIAPSANHRLLVLLANYNDATNVPFTPADAKAKIFTGPFASFYKEQSYGKISFSGDVYGWYTVPRPTGSCDNPTLGWGGDLDGFVASSSINLANYDHVLVVTNCSGGYAKGFAYVGSSPMLVNNQMYNLSTSWVNSSGQMSLQNSLWTFTPPPFAWSNLDSMVAHEVGHGLGLWHANGYDCGAITLDSHAMGQSAICSHVEYGNPFDIMGDERGYGFHTNPFYKEMLGWLDSSNMTTATSSGSYTLAPYETSVGKKAVKIVMAGSSTASYYVEWRQPIGFDRLLANGAVSSNQDGIVITRAYSDAMTPPYNQTRMLDARPTSDTWTNDIKTSTLNGSSVFTDPRTGISIGPITSKTKNAITFSVDIASVACVHENPMFLYPDTYGLNVGPGSTFALFPTVWNDDYTGCAPADMLVTMVLPSGMNASQLTYTMQNLAPENADTAQLPDITVSSSMAPGTYNIGLQVQNLAGTLSSMTSVPIVVQ